MLLVEGGRSHSQTAEVVRGRDGENDGCARLVVWFLPGMSVVVWEDLDSSGSSFLLWSSGFDRVNWFPPGGGGGQARILLLGDSGWD